MQEDKDKSERPEAYPKPTVTDNQIKNQPEYIDNQPSSFENEISSTPTNNEAPLTDSEKGGE